MPDDFEVNFSDTKVDDDTTVVTGFMTAEQIRENEAKILRMVLSCKKNGIDADIIKERVRETYV